MASPWVKEEAQRNELAERLNTAAGWARANPSLSVGVGGSLLGALLLVGLFFWRVSRQGEQAWEKTAYALGYAQAGRPDEAVAQLAAVERDYARTGAAEFSAILAGDILYRQGKYREAADSYKRLLERGPSRHLEPLAHSNLAVAQEAAGDCRASADTNQRLLEAFPEHYLAPQAHASLARCLDVLGQRERAKATYERISTFYQGTYWADWAQARLKAPAP